MDPMNGLELIQNIRMLSSARRAMPIIMLTGKGELEHVSTARDTGITEFVVKPFTAQTLYKRIEEIADKPRGFVLSDVYAGPDRRRKQPAPDKENESRLSAPTQIDSSQKMQGGVKLPALIKPSGTFKKNLGITGPLSSIITPQVLAQAQLAIDAMAGESMKWLKEDLTALQLAHSKLSEESSMFALEKAKESTLSIKSRAGTFGYPLASEAARLLYLFLCADFIPTKKMHMVIFEKHIQTIQVIIAHSSDHNSTISSQLVAELKRLATTQK